MDYRARLEAFGVSWPELSRPNLPFVPAHIVGDFLYVSGQIPEQGADIPVTGKVGAEVDAEAALQSARICAANVIYWAHSALGGDLDRVVKVAKLTVFVNAAPGFAGFSHVANGASDVMNAVFGDRGEHARSAVGMAGLPANVPVEVEAVFQIR